MSTVFDWISSRKYVDAKKLSRKFCISPHLASKMLKDLSEVGLIEVYKRRRGRFTVYRVV